MLVETGGMWVEIRTWRVEYNSTSDKVNLYGTLTRDSRSCILN